MSAYNFRRFSQDQYRAFAVLFHESFGKKISIEEIGLKYDTNRFGADHIGYMAYDENNEPAAFYGVLPTKLIYKGEAIIAAQSADTMTSPRHRRKGLFVDLAVQTYELAKSLEVKLIFGFPNKNSISGFENKLGWEFSGNFSKYSLVGSVLPIGEVFYRMPWLSLIYLYICSTKLRKFTRENFELKTKTNLDGVDQSNDYLSYKMLGKNKFYLNLKGVWVLVKLGNHLIIGDIIGVDKMNLKETISELASLGRRLGYRDIRFAISDSHPLKEDLSGLMKMVDSSKCGYKTLDFSGGLSEFVFRGLDIDTF